MAEKWARIIVQVFDEHGSQTNVVDAIAPWPVLTAHKVLVDDDFFLTFRSESVLARASIPDEV